MSEKKPEKKKRTDPEGTGISRRHFIASAGIGAAGAMATARGVAGTTPDGAESAATVIPSGEPTRVTLRINGRAHTLLVKPRWSLLHVLRERLGLTGAKAGCERGECGSCTVLIDGKPRYACMTLALEAEGSEVTTLEGLMRGEELGDVQRAFLEQDAFQCGYCTPGQIMAVEGLLRDNPDPSLEDVRTGVSGNLCRCGAYPNIFKAARRAAEMRHERGGDS
jgi:xanthine dehydrogenase YagT iron-sulfur-binding subunit